MENLDNLLALAGSRVRNPAVLLIAGFSMIWQAVVAMPLSEPRVARAYHRAKGGVDRIAGGVFLFIGSRLAASG